MSEVAINMVESALAEKEKEIQAKVGNLVIERDELVSALKKLKRGTGSTAGPTVSDEDLVAAVGKLGANGPVKSPDIAKNLGVDPRSISRRLSKFAETGLISGDKDAGYTG